MSDKKWLLTLQKDGSLSSSARSYSDIPAMKKSSANKTHLVSLSGRSENGVAYVYRTSPPPQKVKRLPRLRFTLLGEGTATRWLRLFAAMAQLIFGQLFGYNKKE